MEAAAQFGISRPVTASHHALAVLDFSQMSWLDERFAEAEALEARNRLIEQHAGGVYESLWEQVKLFIDEGRRHSMEILTNGSPFDRIVTVPVTPSPAQRGKSPKQLHIELAKDKHSITATGAAPEICLEIGVCDDGVVCLKSDGAPISIEAAATKILDPFLFPQLPRKY